jgi:hypothetical protein
MEIFLVLDNVRLNLCTPAIGYQELMNLAILIFLLHIVHVLKDYLDRGCLCRSSVGS